MPIDKPVSPEAAMRQRIMIARTTLVERDEPPSGRGDDAYWTMIQYGDRKLKQLEMLTEGRRDVIGVLDLLLEYISGGEE